MDVKKNRPATSPKRSRAKKNQQANFTTTAKTQRLQILAYLLADIIYALLYAALYYSEVADVEFEEFSNEVLLLKDELFK